MQERKDGPWYKNPPNILTAIRFVMIVPVVVLFLQGHRIPSLLLYLLACLTDVLDGHIARKYDMSSQWGKAMDPLADKLMLLAIVTCMFLKGDLPLYIILLVFGKEIVMILGGVFLYRTSKLVIPSNIVGKIGTVLFTIAVVLTFLKENTAPYHWYCMLLAALFSIFSLVQYGVPVLVNHLFVKDKNPTK